jgi:predicted transcriptional regulator
METNNIELTPEQKGMLASLAQETGEPVKALIDKALEDLQERLHAARENGAKGRGQQKEKNKLIWEKIVEAGRRIPDEELESLPTDMAANVDHYAYGLPKRYP